MIGLGEGHPNYVASAILAQKVKQFNEDSVDLFSFYKECTNFVEVDTEQPLQKILDIIFEKIEPLVINVRPTTLLHELRTEIITNLCQQHGFTNLDVNKMQKGEQSRGTDLGKEMLKHVHEQMPLELIIRMLKNSIYSGQEDRNKFIISNFPDTIEQAKAFETGCSTIAAMIQPTANEFEVEIKTPSHFGLESMFQKNTKLKTIKEWNYKTF